MNSETSGGISVLAHGTVGDLSLRSPARVTVDAPLSSAIEEMTAHGRGCVLVTEDGALVGIFTERDVIARIAHDDPAWSTTAVRDVMTPHPMVIRPADSLAEAMRRLVAGRRRHLPVVDDRNAILGLMSIRDILTYVAGKFPDDMINLPPDPDHES